MNNNEMSARTAVENSTIDEANNVTPQLQQCNVVGSTSCKANPYKLVCYNAAWSENKTAKNNAKYWQWEIEHNGFKLP